MIVERSRAARIVVVGLPIVGGMVSGVLLGLIDTAMVGVLGTEALAAVGLSSFLAFIYLGLFYGFSIAVQALVARRKGEGDAAQGGAYLTGAVLLIVVLAPLLSGLLWWAMPTLYPLVNDDPEVVRLGVDYIRWLILQAVFVGFVQANTGYWNGLGETRVYLPALLLMHAANVSFNYIFIFGNFGAPEMGAEGAGFATALSAVVGAALYLRLGLRSDKAAGYLGRLPSRRELSDIVRLAIPAGLQQLLDVIALATTYAIVGMTGTAALACYSVLINFINLVGLPAWGLGTAGATLVGQALGQKDIPDAAAWAWDVIRIGMICMCLIGLPFLLVPEALLSIWIHDPETRELGIVPTRILGAMITINGIGYMFAMMLNGAGDIRRVTWINLLTQWLILVPGAWIAGVWLGYGLIGIWLVHQFLYRAGQSLIFAFIWRGRRWARIAL